MLRDLRGREDSFPEREREDSLELENFLSVERDRVGLEVVGEGGGG